MRFKKERYINQRQSEKTGLWTFQVMIRKGKTITKSFNELDYGSAKLAYDNAIQFRNETLVNLSMGIGHNAKNNKTLEDLLYESFDIMPVREETKRKLLIYFNKYMINDKLSKISKADIIKSLNAMIKDCSDDTITRVLSIYKRCYRTALVNNYISIDQTAGIVPPKSIMIPKDKRNVVTTREKLDQVKECISHTFCESEANAVCAALEVMWYCGLRPCECFALQTDDIKDGYINITKELGSDLADSSEGLDIYNLNIIRRCKTPQSVRKVPIPSKLKDILNNYTPEGHILFPNRFGDYFNIGYLGTRIHAIDKDFNMYRLRHTLATSLVTSNVDQRTTTEILGHNNIGMSVYYARSNEELKKKALEDIQK